MTEEVVAPLDAYATAKPDEPVFTLQGGDPLAAPLVRLWAQLARLRTGLGKGLWPPSFTDAENAVLNHDVSHDEKESANLLLRATAAEEVSWAMDAYVNGNRNSDVPIRGRGHASRRAQAHRPPRRPGACRAAT
jgi:hypothetical protein